jgi:hypothetical protein
MWKVYKSLATNSVDKDVGEIISYDIFLSDDIIPILYLTSLRIALKLKLKLRNNVSAPSKFRPTLAKPSSEFIRS